MRFAVLLLLLLSSVLAPARADLGVVRLRTEYRVDPLAVASEHPRLFWNVESRQRGQRQSAYRVLVASRPDLLARGEGDLWDSGKVPSDETLHIVYGGKPLTMGQSAYWKVMVWDRDGKASRWSRPARWGAGPRTDADWSGSRWIAAPASGAGGVLKGSPEGASWIWDGPEVRAPKAGTRFFRTRFDLPADRAIRSAVLAVSADDSHRTRINGQDVARGDSWQNYQVVDVRKALKVGPNTVTVEATNGVDGPAGVVLKLVVAFDSGETVVATGSGWESARARGGPWTPAGVVGAFGIAPWGSGRPAGQDVMPPAPYFRKRFVVVRPVRRAMLYATALGLYEFSLNGRQVGDDALAPGWTEYRKRVDYHAYDVTAQVRSGENALGAILGDGWYAGYLAFTGRRRVYGGDPKLRAQLVLEYADGATETIGTDGSWRTTNGPIVHADLLMGCAIDYRKEMPGWNLPGFVDTAWAAAAQVEAPGVAIEPHPGSAVRPQQTLPARRRLSPKPGVWIYDFGQNLTGVVRLTVRGKAGQTVALRHAEFLDKDGGIYIANLRAAKATDSFTLARDGATRCEPKFTFHGFQYVEVTGCDTPPDLKDVTAVVLHSDLEKTGTFTTDNPLLNRLAINTDWGQRGNYLDVPTDCPQRDERAGWTGDAQVFTKAAAFNRDIAAFTTKWLVDLVEDSQRADGAFGDVAPHIAVVGFGNAAWEDAGVVCVYRMYEMYGDTQAIRTHWDALTRFMAHLKAVAPNGLRESGAYGDWLRLDGPQHGKVLGTAYYVQDARMMAALARAIGKTDEAAAYDALASTVRDAFIKAFVKDDGRVEENGQTGQTFYALALNWDLLPAELRPAAAGHLVRLIHARGDHLATGFIGTPVLLPALRGAGQASLADKLLLSETFPSWLYQVKIGATTMWERWDGWTPEKGFQDAGMNSFNHYWLGCVTEYLHTAVGGIDTDGPGFKKLVLRPETDSGLKTVRAEYDSIRGKVVSAWTRKDDGTLDWTVTLPANVTARVEIPAEDGATVTEGGKPLEGAHRANGRTVVEIGSGTYRFAVRTSAR